jgi:high affinity Mn2+ porin
VKLLQPLFAASLFLLAAQASRADMTQPQERAPFQTTRPQAVATVDPLSERWSLHLQATEVIQGQPGFHSPYEGTNSLLKSDHGRQTTSADIYLGLRLWEGGEVYFNPEYYQGFGLRATHGIAAFPNGEAYKVGTAHGDGFIPHFFYRQVIGFGGEREELAADLLQLGSRVDVERLTITGGRLMVGDQFDLNAYAHDQRHQFMNWALIDMGAFDYAADALGAIEGLTLDLNQKNWALRWGIFDVPKVSNSNAKDTRLKDAWQQVVELETRYQLLGHAGKTRFLAFMERAHMGSYSQAVSEAQGAPADIIPTRRYRYQQGVGVNMEQEITPQLGAFFKGSWRDGKSEAWQFTDIDRSVCAGVQLKGDAWNRSKDTFGVAGIMSGLGASHKAYQAAGGLGPIIGDDQLPHYGTERVMETYYDATVYKGLHAALDYQLVVNPAYNRDRGPVHLFGVRFHFEY